MEIFSVHIFRCLPTAHMTRSLIIAVDVILKWSTGTCIHVAVTSNDGHGQAFRPICQSVYQRVVCAPDLCRLPSHGRSINNVKLERINCVEPRNSSRIPDKLRNASGSVCNIHCTYNFITDFAFYSIENVYHLNAVAHSSAVRSLSIRNVISVVMGTAHAQQPAQGLLLRVRATIGTAVGSASSIYHPSYGCARSQATSHAEQHVRNLKLERLTEYRCVRAGHDHWQVPALGLWVLQESLVEIVDVCLPHGREHIADLPLDFKSYPPETI